MNFHHEQPARGAPRTWLDQLYSRTLMYLVPSIGISIEQFTSRDPITDP